MDVSGKELVELIAKISLAKTTSVECKNLPFGVRRVPNGGIDGLEHGLYFFSGTRVILSPYVDGSVYLDVDAKVKFVGRLEDLSPNKAFIAGSAYVLDGVSLDMELIPPSNVPISNVHVFNR